MVSVISAILFIIRCCKRLHVVAVKSVILTCPFPLPLYSQFCSPPALQCHRCLDVLHRGTCLSFGGRWGGMGVVLNLGEGWPPVSLLYPLRYRKKRDPGDNVGSTQPRLGLPERVQVYFPEQQLVIQPAPKLHHSDV